MKGTVTRNVTRDVALLGRPQLTIMTPGTNHGYFILATTLVIDYAGCRLHVRPSGSHRVATTGLQLRVLAV